MESTAPEPLTDKPVVDESVGDGAQHSDHSVSSRKRILIIILVAVLVVACGVTGGVFAYRQYEHAQAVSACVQTVKPLRLAVSRLSTVQTGKTTTELVKLDVKKLADKTTHDKLTQAVKPVNVSVASCEQSLTTNQLVAREKANKKALQKVTTAHTQVEQAVNAMLKSRTMKSRTVLTELVKSARGLVKDSQGKVADQKTIDSLNAILTTADKLTQDKTADYTKLDKQTTDVQKAIDSVKASVEAKRKADEEAARKAEEERQAQAAAQAAQQAQTYRAQSYRAPAQSYRAPAQTYRAPAQTYRAPAQSAPQQAAPQHKLGGVLPGGEIENCPPSGCAIAICDGKHYCPLG